MSQKQTVVTAEQYQALQQRPIELPSSNDLFDFEVEELVAKKLATYAQADQFRKKLPDKGLFLFVAPCPTHMSLDDLMFLMKVDGKSGVSYLLDFRYLEDKIDVPLGPYIMVDVEDGSRRRNIKSSVNKENILREGRSPYIAHEGIIHAILFPEVLKHHYLDLVGSRWEANGYPFLYHFDDGGPGLDASSKDSAFSEWGAPSCKNRIEA